MLLTVGSTAATPVAKPAADGDIDGDGRTDSATVLRSGNGFATVTAQLTRLGRQSIDIEATGAPGLATVMGVVDADSDGYAELFVQVDQGASTGSASIVRLVNGRLAAMVTTTGFQARFDYGGSVTHQNSFGCSELATANPGRELFSWSGTSGNGLTYSGSQTVYRLSGGSLVALTSYPRTVGPGSSAPTGCGSLSYR